MQKTNTPILAGTFSIISAAFGLIGAILMLVYSFFFIDMFFPMEGFPGDIPFEFT